MAHDGSRRCGRHWRRRRASGRLAARRAVGTQLRGLSRRHLLFSGRVALAYAAGAELAYSWFGAGVFPVFFPAAGVTLSALVLTRRAAWPFVLAGAGAAEIAVDLAHGSDLAPALGWATANLTEALAGALLLRWAVRGRAIDLGRRADLLAFLALPVAFSPMLGGLIGAANAELLGGGADWPLYFLRWWAGDGLGVLVVGGAVLAVACSGVARVRARWLEALALGSAATAATVLIFAVEDVHWVYVPFVVMPWIALRLGPAAVAVVGGVIAIIAAQQVSLAPSLWNAMDVPPSSGVLYVQAAIALMTATSLLLAAEAGERDDAVRERARATSGSSSAATGTRPWRSPEGGSASRWATSWATAWRPRPRWGSCGRRWPRSPRTAPPRSSCSSSSTTSPRARRPCSSPRRASPRSTPRPASCSMRPPGIRPPC